jgi:hypothetical protein
MANFPLLLSSRLCTCSIPLTDPVDDSTTFAENWLPYLALNHRTSLRAGGREDLRFTRYDNTHQQL